MGASGLSNHVIIIPILLGISGRDAWIAILAAIIPLMLWLLMIYYIIKSTAKSNIFIWMEYHNGKWLSIPIRIILLMYFFTNIIITIRDTVDWTLTSYLPQTPSLFLILAIVIVCSYAAHKGLQTVAIATGLVMPLVIILGYFVAIANIVHKQYSLLFPLLEYGPQRVISGMVFAGAGFAELIVLLLLQNKLGKPLKLKWLLFLGIIMVMLTFGPTTGSIAEFGPIEATSQRFPAFEQWKLVKVGRYFEHMDFLSIYQWLAGAFVRISLYIYIVMEYLPFGKNKVNWKTGFVTVSLILLAYYLPLSTQNFIDTVRQYHLPISLMGIVLITILLFGFSYFARKKEGISYAKNP